MFRFDPTTHQYWWKTKKLISVTQLVSKQFKPFNSRRVAMAIQKKSDPESPYSGMTAIAIMKQWEETGLEAREEGTKLHADIENHIKTGAIPETPSTEFQQYLNLRNDHPEWKIKACEQCVWNEQVAGTIDCIIETPEGDIIIDWKRTKKIEYGNSFARGIGVMKHAEDCNFIRYSLQLALYRHLWQTQYKTPIHSTKIAVFHPTQDNYQLIDAYPFTHEAEAVLATAT